MGVLKGKADNIPPSDLEGGGDGLDGYFAHGELVGCDIGESMMVGSVKEGRLFESFEDGLADYLHKINYSRLLYQLNHHKSIKEFI